MRASYPAAVAWLALHDDCRWLYDGSRSLSDAAQLVLHLFGKTTNELQNDILTHARREKIPHAR
jgi:hypothetical protein